MICGSIYPHSDTKIRPSLVGHRVASSNYLHPSISILETLLEPRFSKYCLSIALHAPEPPATLTWREQQSLSIFCPCFFPNCQAILRLLSVLLTVLSYHSLTLSCRPVGQFCSSVCPSFITVPIGVVFPVSSAPLAISIGTILRDPSTCCYPSTLTWLPSATTGASLSGTCYSFLYLRCLSSCSVRSSYWCG